ncbi:hypothetical protein JDM601_2948 [Mycolicibacter sinensis]|uniref:Uncharacterized protein n=1 Tax=Mycolicibacter sinensis (strain JDM601) TaxID=875328 RepID=F5Z160_MYCSD|nr:hypothetical protein JDM601_2948 [Mycolicibacter sinensis]
MFDAELASLTAIGGLGTAGLVDLIQTAARLAGRGPSGG